MGQYHIYHRDMSSGIADNIAKQNRDYAGSVEAISLEHAFMKSQNLSDDWNKENPCRSTSIGDVIQDDDNDEFFMITGSGFQSMNDIQDLALLESRIDDIDEAEEDAIHRAIEEESQLLEDYDIEFYQNMLDNPEDHGLI